MFFEFDACIKLNNTRIKIKLTWSTRSFNSHCFTIVWILVRLITEQLKHSVNTTVFEMNIKKIVITFHSRHFCSYRIIEKELRTIMLLVHFSSQFIITSNFVFNITQYNLQVLGSLNTYDSWFRKNFIETLCVLS